MDRSLLHITPQIQMILDAAGVLRVEQVPSPCTETDELVLLLLLGLGRVPAGAKGSDAWCLSSKGRRAVVLLVLVTATSPMAAAAVQVGMWGVC